MAQDKQRPNGEAASPPRIPPFLGSGWHHLDPEGAEEVQKANLERAEEDKALDLDIAATFATAQGQRVFKWLWQATVMQPTFDGSLPMDRAVPWGFAREGQNSIVRELRTRMERANG